MTRGKSLAEVRAFWTAAARTDLDAAGLKPTARDPNLQAVVEANVAKWIPPGSEVLDIGCGDGASTLRFAKDATRIVGVDYIPEFVERASEAAARDGLAHSATFTVGDVMDLGPVRSEHGAFDVVITVRCLINLVSRANQEHAIAEIASCVRPGGLYLTSEGWQEGRDGLNRRRVHAGLPAMDLVDHNLLMTREAFEAAASPHFDVVGYEPAGLYLFVSRVLQPLYVAPDEPSVAHPLNAIAAALQLEANAEGCHDFADCDYAGVYVLRRRTS